jgi:hypothetical protein
MCLLAASTGCSTSSGGTGTSGGRLVASRDGDGAVSGTTGLSTKKAFGTEVTSGLCVEEAKAIEIDRVAGRGGLGGLEVSDFRVFTPTEPPAGWLPERLIDTPAVAGSKVVRRSCGDEVSATAFLVVEVHRSKPQKVGFESLEIWYHSGGRQHKEALPYGLTVCPTKKLC